MKRFQLGFLVYDSRSGSTLLSALLNQYAVLSVSQESNFVSNVLEYERETFVQRKDISDLLAVLTDEVQFTEMDMDLDVLEEELSARLPISKKNVIAIIAEHYHQNRDPSAAFLIIKGARQMYHLNTLHEYFGESRMIHVYRDGRAVFASKLHSEDIEGNFMEKNIVMAARDWKRKMKILTGDERVVNVKYEDLLEDRNRVLNGILDQLGVADEDREVSKAAEQYSDSIGERQKHLHSNVASEPDSSIATRWKRELTMFDILVYEILNRRQLESYGYEPVALRPECSIFTIIKAYGYILFSFVSLLVRKVKKGIILTTNPKRLRKKISEKIFEYRAVSNKP